MRAVRAGRSDGLRRHVVRRAPLSHQLLDVVVSRGHLRSAEPADQAHSSGIRRRDPALPSPRAGRRARGDGRPHVGGARRVRDRALGAVRADGDGNRSAQLARHVGRVAPDDSADLGGWSVFVGGPVLERAATRRAPQALSEAPPAHLGGRAAAGDVRAGRRNRHRRDGAQRGGAVLSGAAHQAVQGARAPREARRQVHQRPVAQLHHGPLRLGQQRRPRAGGELAANVLRAGSSLSQGSDASLRAARRLLGRRAGAPEGELRPLSQDRGRSRLARGRRRASGRSLRRVRPDRRRPLEPDRRRHAGRPRGPRGGRSGQLSQGHRDPRGRRRRRAAIPDGDRDGPPRQGDDLDRALRQARHPRAEEKDESMISAKPDVEALTPYVAPLEGRRPLLRLDFNESTVGPSPAVVDAIRSLPADAYATYPEYAGLNEAFAATLGVAVKHVEAFNGVDAAIRAIFDAYGERGGTFLTTVPTFGYYEPCAPPQGMGIDQVPDLGDLKYPLVALTRRLEARPRLFFICKPNNPTGTLMTPQAIVALARAAPETLVVVDEL